jgi:hypothetical protein
MDPTKFGAVKEVQIKETGNVETTTWVLVDDAGRSASFTVGPEALGQILHLTCSLVDRAASKPQQVPPPASGGVRKALPAQSIEVNPGRTPKEVALRVHLGKVDIAYLLPLDSVVIAMGTLVSGLYADPEGPAH